MRDAPIELERLDDEIVWQEIAAHSQQATFFHTPFWQHLALSEQRRWRGASLCFTLSSGTTGVFPFTETRSIPWGPLSRLTSSAFGCYGGPIAEDRLHEDETLLILEAVRSRLNRSVIVVEDPLAPLPRNVEAFDVRWDFTHILPLHLGLEAVRARQSRKRQGHIRKGRRLGVVSRFGYSMDDFRAYYRLYEESLRRWGDRATSRYSWQLFESLQALAVRHPHTVGLWLAEMRGEPVSGLILFHWNGRTVWWHAGTSQAGLRADAVSVLVSDVIEDSIRRGFAWFDFNPSGGHDGVAYFKEEFGAERMPLRILSFEPAYARALRSIKAAAQRVLP